MTTITLYFGGSEQDNWPVIERLQMWCQEHKRLYLECRYIHDDPAFAFRVGITELPALVIGRQLLAQGNPQNWLTDKFLDDLSNQTINLNFVHTESRKDK